MRRYSSEPLAGVKVEHRSRKELRKLLGRKVEFNTRGWLSKSSGELQEIQGYNLLIDGNWYWLPDIELMHVLPRKNGDSL